MGRPTTDLSVSVKPLVFALNGQRVELPFVDPATTLLSFIRAETPFKGTKRGCGEGGCGACVVALTKYNTETKEVKVSTVNSCLVLLCSIDGCAITTTEGLGNQRDGLHAIHKRFSAFHATQCGFCTPGMTMAIYGCLKHDQEEQQKNQTAPKVDESSYTNGSTTESHCTGPTAEKLERAIGGNICRCTGYRPILDVCKSFASDVDLEDLGLNTCWGNKSGAHPSKLPSYDPSADPEFPKFLIEELESRLQHKNSREFEVDSGLVTRFIRHGEGNKEERAWVSASSLAEVGAALKVIKKRYGIHNAKLVVGNTSSGIYKDIPPQVFVDISQIPELLAVHRCSGGLEVGAATRIAEFIDLLEEFGPSKDEPVAQALADHLKKLAAGHVRNWGSIGGNLVMAQQLAFDSDLATILLGAGASVKVVFVGSHEGSGTHTVSNLNLEEFLSKGALGEFSLLQSVFVPLGQSIQGSNSGRTIFKTFRGAPRPFGNAVSYANAAFLAQLVSGAHSVQQGNCVIGSVRLAFGAVGTKHAIRAVKVEKHLADKPLTPQLVLECVELLKKEIVPREGTTKREFRVSLAVAFLFEFLNPLVSSEPDVAPASLCPHVGKQIMTITDEHYPVSLPLSKVASQLQASGEAVYVDDIPSPPRCLHAAFVMSTEPFAKLNGVDSEAALQSEGAVDYVSVRDIPEGGKNFGSYNPWSDYTEPLFAEDAVNYVTEPIGVVVADTYDNARIAALKVKVDYDNSIGSPIMNLDDAIARNSIHPLPPQVHLFGDIEKGFAGAEFQLEGEVLTPTQYHFYMETQTCLAIPDEDGCITIYASTQAPGLIQQTVANCLNLPMHNVRVITRRVGGGFGGKAVRNQVFAVAVALAAYKLRRPVRVSLDRNTDMHMVGGRSPIRTKYKVGFNKTGKITALKVDVLIEGGWHPDLSPVLTGQFEACIKKYNVGSFDATFTVFKTNNIPKGAVRAPGDVQGSAVADTVQDHVAAFLGMSGNKVREENLHSHQSITLLYGEQTAGDANAFTLKSIWNQLKARTKLIEREKEVDRFNLQSRWLKRGVAMVTSVYGCWVAGKRATVGIFQDGSIVAEVDGVEMGQGLHTKVRQVIAYSLSPLCTKEQSLELISKIRVLQADTLSLPNTICDGGSTTSEGTCAAVQKCCAVLVQRLLPVKEDLVQAQPDGKVPWGTLCLTARSMNIDLQSHELWAPALTEYLLYGAGVSEVEVNTLTGETRILSSDLLYDSGKSLNPAVDIGQVEGAFVFGIGFFLTEETVRDATGKLLSDGTWTYKPPTIDTIPREFNVELFKSPAVSERVLSSKASGEPPLLLSGSVHSAIHNAVIAARKDYRGANAGGDVPDVFIFDPPATMDKVKKLCGLDNVERYLRSLPKKCEARRGKII